MPESIKSHTWNFSCTPLVLIKTSPKQIVLLFPAAVYLFCLFLFITSSYCVFDFPLDDAWIHRVYSRSFAFGHGFQYNPGIQETGSTSPFWAIVSCPAHWLESLGNQWVTASVKLIGVLLGFVSVFSIYIIARQITGSGLVAPICASLFAVSPRFLFSSLSGMENNLLTALWLSGTAAILGGRCMGAMVLFGLATVTRPEATVILPFAATVIIYYVARQRMKAPMLFTTAIALIPGFIWLLFCRLSTGYWLPNTFIKAHPFNLGAEIFQFSWIALTVRGLPSLSLFIPGIIVCVLWCIFCRRDAARCSLFMLVLSPAAYLLGVTGTRMIALTGYYWTRWFDPASLVLTAAFCLGYAIILAGIADQRLILPARFASRAGYRFAVRGFAAAAIAGILFSTGSYSKTFNERRGHISSDARAINLINVQTGKWINSNTPLNAIVGVNDAGAIRYFGRRQTTDLLGLNNSDLIHGKTSFAQALSQVNWIAVFSGFIQERIGLNEIYRQFDFRRGFKIPVEEYTVSNSPRQTIKVIMERKK